MDQQPIVKTKTKTSTMITVGFAIGAILGAGAFFFVNTVQEDAVDEAIANKLNLNEAVEMEEAAPDLTGWTEEGDGIWFSPDGLRYYAEEQAAGNIAIIGGDILVYKSKDDGPIIEQICGCPTSCFVGQCTWNGTTGRCTGTCSGNSSCPGCIKTTIPSSPVPEGD